MAGLFMGCNFKDGRARGTTLFRAPLARTSLKLLAFHENDLVVMSQTPRAGSKVVSLRSWRVVCAPWHARCRGLRVSSREDYMRQGCSP